MVCDVAFAIAQCEWALTGINCFIAVWSGYMQHIWFVHTVIVTVKQTVSSSLLFTFNESKHCSFVPLSANKTTFLEMSTTSSFATAVLLISASDKLTVLTYRVQFLLSRRYTRQNVFLYFMEIEEYQYNLLTTNIFPEV